jgi:hypothetical protein
MRAIVAESVSSIKPRRKWLRRVGWSLLVLVGGVVGFWTWSYYSALWERDALIAEIRAKGEPVWWDEVAEKALSEPTEGTGAKYYLEVINAVGGETNSKTTKVPSTQLLNELEKDKYAPRVHPLVEKELNLAAPAIAALEKAVRLSPGLIVRRIKTTEPIAIILSEVVDVRRLARILHWEAFDALAKGDERRSYHAAWLSFATSQQVTRDPCVMAQLNRFFVLNEAFQQLSMCLSHAPVHGEEFDAIDRFLAGLENGFEVKDSMMSQRSMLLTTWENEKHFQFIGIIEWQRTPNRNTPSYFFYKRWMDLLSTPLGRPTLLRSQVEYMKAFNRFAPMIDDPEAATMEIEVDDLERASTFKQTVGNAEWLDLRLFRSMHRRCRTIHRQIVFARLALRLRRLYDRHGRLPETLDELCDDMMPTIRLEWFQNQPIVYKPRANGFRLELPESIVPPEARYRLSETPILSDFGLEIEFKTVKQGSPK